MGHAPDVAWLDGNYMVAFAHLPAGTEPHPNAGLYSARFSGAGLLLEAPYRMVEGVENVVQTRLVPDTSGYVFSWTRLDPESTYMPLHLVRLDQYGRQVAHVVTVVESSSDPYSMGVLSFDVAWTSENLAVAYNVSDLGLGDQDTIFIQLYELSSS
jgi:hypothetical protein